jgi:outer membrane protein OmpA-like peptidoglycan-associated protein
MKNQILSIVAVFTSVFCIGQGNMIQNGSFESVGKKIKEGGMIESATGWTSPTDSKADVFSAYAKSDEYKTPTNLYGDTDPLDGKNYAGIMIYSYKDEAPRQYLQAKLTEKMVEEKVYCVKMNVMLSMLSKYSSNNIGIYISAKPLTAEEIAAQNIQPQIIHSQNRIFEEQFDWEAICQTYIADGGEEYITIGNFGTADATQNEKVKKPKGFTGMQARGAYYFVDDVSVMNMAGLQDCDCELDAGGKSLNVVYSVETITDMEMDVSQDIERTRVYFDDRSDLISELAMADLEKVAELLKDHAKYKVKIIGHTDPVEEAKSTGNVSLNRANAVKKALVDFGVSESKLLVVGVQDFEPITKDATSAGQAQNRRVMFSVISKN